MLPLILTVDATTPAGMYPDAVPSLPFNWEFAQNVEFQAGGVKAAGEREPAVAVSTFPIRGLGALRSIFGVQELYFGTLGNLYRSVALAIPVEVGTAYTTQQHQTALLPAGHWQFAAWGDWMLATNGVDKLQVRKGAGNFAPVLEGGVDPLPFTRARLLARLGPHILVGNLNGGPSQIRWCSDDDIESWDPLSTNTAGEYTLRDTDSELMAWAPLGDRLGVYTRDSMYTITYIGSPFIFSVMPALNGVGAWSSESIVSVGREHFGWGPAGFFKTDGAQFQYIDEGSVRDWIRPRVFLNQESKICGYHNERRQQVEWYYPTTQTGECDEGIAFNYAKGAWVALNRGYSAVLARDVFQYALGAAASVAVYAENVGSPAGMELSSRPIGFGAYGRTKFISEIRILYTGTVDVTIGYHEKVNDPVTWLPSQTLDGSWDVVDVCRSAKFFRVKLSGGTAWKVQAFEFYGRGGGKQK